MQGDDAFVGHVPTWHHLHHKQTLLQILDWAQPLQTRVLNVDALIKLDFLQIFQTIWFKKKKKKEQRQAILLTCVTVNAVLLTQKGHTFSSLFFGQLMPE